jgi:hypothetical protein
LRKGTSIRSFSAFAVAAAGLSAATITNPSFEQPITSGYIYNPADPTGGWLFSGFSGVAANTFFAPPPPDGRQAAFLQQYVGQGATLSSITQNLTAVLPLSVVTFYLAQRPGFAANPVVVSYAGTPVGTFTPSSTAFTPFTANFGAGAPSAGTLAFSSAATTTGDLNTAIDLVSITAVPEPSTVTLLIAPLGLLAYFHRRSIG